MTLPPTTTLAGIFGEKKPHGDGPITLEQAAACVDQIDRKLFAEGTIGVITPSVWGQNRMTTYRAEYEVQMATRVNQFQLMLQAAQNRTDISSLTSATSLGATVAAAQTKKSGPFASIAPKSFLVNAGTTPTAAATLPTGGSLTYSGGASPVFALAPPPPTPATPAAPTPADPGNPDFAGLSAQLAAISQRLDTLKQGTLTLPSNINNFATQAGQPGVGIEPTIALDQEGNYINHLHQLRRVNAGDDLTDLAGYGLYLLRMPVTLMPGPESRKGKGAIVTVEARHELTDDLLPNTFRDVAILDLTYALTQIINERIHRQIFEKCHQREVKRTPINPDDKIKDQKDSTKPIDQLPEALPSDPGYYDPYRSQAFSQGNANLQTHLDVPNNVAGPLPVLLRDMQFILGSLEETTGGAWSKYFADIARLSDEEKGIFFENELKSQKQQYDKNKSLFSSKPEEFRLRKFTEKLYTVRTSDRLHLLVETMRASQRDPFRHDPSTLSMLQASILDAWRYMRDNEALNCTLFQVERIEQLGESLRRRDYTKLREQREQFLYELHCYRNNKTPQDPRPRFPQDPRPMPPQTPDKDFWSDQVQPSDVLAFALLVQFINVESQLKWDMRYMAQRRGCTCGEVDAFCFYEFNPSQEARNAFRDYVMCKWPLRIYSVDPVLDQQNVLDAYSRRTELQLALAASVATGQFNIKNATSYARQLDLDLQTVGLNRTSVGFGAGETTFGWMFYPRVQTPQPVSNFRNFTNVLTGTGQGINADLRSRRIEPGQRECIALMVTPNFIPALRVSTVTNWFDATGLCAKPRMNNQEMMGLGRVLQQAKAAVARACASGEYRPTDFTVLNQRIKQLEALLPTQDRRVDLPDEGDLLGSEIFSPSTSGLSPSLLAWYGEPIQDGVAGSIFLQGRGFSVSETQVIVGGVPLIQGTGFRLISRNVMQIVVPANARAVKVQLDEEGDPHQTPAASKSAVATLSPTMRPTIEAKGGKAEVGVGNDHARAELDPTLNPDVDVTIQSAGSSANVRGSKVDVQIGDFHARAEGAAKQAMLPCDRAVIDVHIATPNGISNHLYVEVVPKPKPPATPNAVTTATTTTTVHGNTTTTSTRFETTPPGTVLPPLTVLPMGTPWPPATVLAPGPVAGAPTGSLLPGLVPTPAATPPLPITPNPPLSLTPPATPTPMAPPIPTTIPQAAPPSNITPPPAPPSTSAAPAPPAASPMVVAGRVDGRLGTAAFESTSADLTLPPLPAERPRSKPAKGIPSPKGGGGPAEAGPTAARRIGPAILRRIGLPER